MAMPYLHSCRLFVATALAAVLLALSPNPAQALTQRDWMIALVDSLGRSFGLPDSPQPDDYINILLGKRNLRFEAEAVRSEDDEVSTLAFLNYGPFSGSGWLLGTSRPTNVHLRFVLPLDGRYRLSVAVHQPGHTLKIGEQSFAVNGDKQKFSKIEVGEFTLTAGFQEIIVTLPPGGALDYLELSAPNLPPIAPDGGWQPDAALTWDTLAVTSVQALHLDKGLPPTDRSLAVEAETAPKIDGSLVVEDAHLGRPSGGRWLRTTTETAKVDIPVEIAQGGFYDLDLTMLGARIDLLINGLQPLSIEGKPYLETVTAPTVFLPKGQNHLEVTLPPGSGLDRIIAKARQSDLAALAAVLGLTIAGDAPASVDIDRLTARLSSATR